MKTVAVQPHDSRRRGRRNVRRSCNHGLLRISAAQTLDPSCSRGLMQCGCVLCTVCSPWPGTGGLWGQTGVRATYNVFFGAQNSSYGGDGRSSTLPSSREEKLVGFPLNLSHPPLRNGRLAACGLVCVHVSSALSAFDARVTNFPWTDGRVRSGALVGALHLTLTYPRSF